MAQMTLAEATSQLATVNAAIESLIRGERINQLRVGSGTFARLYVYSETTLEELKEHRNELLATVDMLEERTPTFKKNMHIPMIVGKDIF